MNEAKQRDGGSERWRKVFYCITSVVLLFFVSSDERVRVVRGSNPVGLDYDKRSDGAAAMTHFKTIRICFSKEGEKHFPLCQRFV